MYDDTWTGLADFHASVEEAREQDADERFAAMIARVDSEHGHD